MENGVRARQRERVWLTCDAFVRPLRQSADWLRPLTALWSTTDVAANLRHATPTTTAGRHAHPFGMISRASLPAVRRVSGERIVPVRCQRRRELRVAGRAA